MNEPPVWNLCFSARQMEKYTQVPHSHILFEKKYTETDSVHITTGTGFQGRLYNDFHRFFFVRYGNFLPFTCIII